MHASVTQSDALRDELGGVGQNGSEAQSLRSAIPMVFKYKKNLVLLIYSILQILQPLYIEISNYSFAPLFILIIIHTCNYI